MSGPRKPTLIESMACGGGAAAFAVNFTHPIELVKTRMQASGGSIGSTISNVMKEGGVASFWKGLPFAYGRELSYTSVKLGACKFFFFFLLEIILKEMVGASCYLPQDMFLVWGIDGYLLSAINYTSVQYTLSSQRHFSSSSSFTSPP